MKLNLKDYVHPSLKVEVPKEIRKEVYEIAILGKVDLSEHGLCLALPMILWNLKSYLDNPLGLEIWDFNHTHIAFPELNKDRIRYIYSSSIRLREARIKVLNEMLKEVS